MTKNAAETFPVYPRTEALVRVGCSLDAAKWAEDAAVEDAVRNGWSRIEARTTLMLARQHAVRHAEGAYADTVVRCSAMEGATLVF